MKHSNLLLGLTNWEQSRNTSAKMSQFSCHTKKGTPLPL